MQKSSKLINILDQLFSNFWKVTADYISHNFNPLTTGKDHFWSICFLTLWEIEIAVIFLKYEK